MSQSTNRTRKPDPTDRAFVAQLVERLGVVRAAKEIGLSRLAILNVVSGGDCYQPTLEAIAAAARMNPNHAA